MVIPPSGRSYCGGGDVGYIVGSIGGDVLKYVPTRDRLPDDDEARYGFSVFSQSRDFYMARFSDGRWITGHNHDDNPITHWAPLDIRVSDDMIGIVMMRVL